MVTYSAPVHEEDLVFKALADATRRGVLDALFEHDGQITKREVRAVTLSSLTPRRGERLWDIGAGAGSVAIEWLLADRSLAAIAIEARPDRAARILALNVHLGGRQARHESHSRLIGPGAHSEMLALTVARSGRAWRRA